MITTPEGSTTIYHNINSESAIQWRSLKYDPVLRT